MPKTPVSKLIPLPSGLRITAVCESPDGLLVYVSSARRRAKCPLCSKPSSHVHSHYSRSPADLPCVGRPFRLLLSVRRFFCKVATCPRKVFAERLPELLEPSSRFTTRLRAALQQVGFSCRGKGGERLATVLGMKAPDTTILWSVQLVRIPTVDANQVRVVGVDDWSWRRGQRYGTIIVDLQRQQVLDLLPDRSVESVRTWLAAHPNVEVVSRDRGANYIDGVTQGAPQATQVADRWHLYENLGDAVEAFLVRAQVRAPKPPVQPVPAVPGAPSPSSPATLCIEPIPDIQPIPPSFSATPRSLQRSQQSLVRKWELQQRVHEILSQRRSLHQIARELDMSRNTVRKYARQPVPKSLPHLRTKPRCPSVLDPYEAYLLKRWSGGSEEGVTGNVGSGCRNGAQLFREIRELGYTGGKSVVKSYIGYLRKHTDPSELPYSRNLRKERAESTSPREIRWLLARQQEDLNEEQRARLQRLLETSTDMQRVHPLLQNFHIMLGDKHHERLDCWLEQASKSGITEIKSFAVGVRRDYDAVKAAIMLPWSQGQTEGQVNKLKTVKRAMYGRAGFALLRQRLLSGSVATG